VLRQPLEDTKVFECPEVLEFNQIFDLSRVSWLRRSSCVPYPLPFSDPSLSTPLSTSSQDDAGAPPTPSVSSLSSVVAAMSPGAYSAYDLTDFLLAFVTNSPLRIYALSD